MSAPRALTPMDILERIYALERGGHEIFPWHCIVGLHWLEDPVTKDSVHQLKRAGIIAAAGVPGFFKLP